MKTLVLVFLVVVGCAHRPFEDWSKADTARQAVYTALHVTDWAQTIEFRSNDRQEANPLLGSHPNAETVHLFIGSSLIAHTAISALLQPKYRRIWQYFWIGAEGWAVYHNHYSCGVRVGF